MSRHYRRHAPMTVGEMAELIAEALDGDCDATDWADYGEVTLRHGGRTFRFVVRDITSVDDKGGGAP